MSGPVPPPSPAAAARRAGTAANLLLAAASLAATLFLAEALLRGVAWWREARGGGLEERLERSRRHRPAAGGELALADLVQPSPHADIVYELRPNLSGAFQGRPFSVNSRGMRGREVVPAKGPGVFRIAGLGDSVMFGWGVAQGESYLELLERRLNERAAGSPRYEVLNFAVPGYNTAVEAAVFERKALPLAPDLVVMQFVNNDFGVPSFLRRPADPLSLRRLFLAEFVGRQLLLLRGRDATDLVPNDLGDLEGEDRERIIERYRYMVGAEGYRRAMGRLAALTRPAGIPVVVILGARSPEQEAVVRSTAREHGFDLLEVGPYTDAYVSRHGIEDTPAARKRALWVSPTDHHPNAAGHTIYAEALEERLRALGAVR